MIDEFTVDLDLIKLKFNKTPLISDLTNDKFVLSLEDATPSTVADAFLDIDIREHYKSVARVLYLFFSEDLTPGKLYTLTVSGIADPFGRDLGTWTHSFVLGERTPEGGDPEEIAEVIDNVSPEYSAATPSPIEVEDHSIISGVFSVDTTTPYNPDFYVTEVDPEQTFVDEDYNDGRITVKFSTYPLAKFINSTYFKVQRKELGVGITRWETLDTEVSVDGENPWVYIDLPSTDATPVYHEPDKVYFEEGYKYRLKISKDIGV